MALIHLAPTPVALRRIVASCCKYRAPARKILHWLSAALTALLVLGSATPVAAADFAANFGGTVGGGATTSATTTDTNGNVYVAGIFDGAKFTLGSVTLSKIGIQDAFAAKLDASGTVLWAKNYGGSGTTAIASGIAVDASGNVYLGGYFYGDNLTTPALTKIGNQDAFAFKLDASGNTTWAKNYGGNGAYATATGIAVDASGNVYLGGYFFGGNLTTPALTMIGNQDGFAFKLNSSGNTTWAQNYGGVGASTQATGIVVDTSGNAYLAGSFGGTTFTLGNVILSTIGSQDAFVAKLDSSGVVLWAKNYGGSGASATASGIAVDASSNVYLGGYFYRANLTTPMLTKIGTQDAFAFKLDTAGNTAWAKNHGGSGTATILRGIAVDGSGNVYLAGHFFGGNLAVPPLSMIGREDAFAFKLDSSGNTTWAKNYGGRYATAVAIGIAVDTSGNIYLGGGFSGDNLITPALTEIGSHDAFAFKLDSSGNTAWAKNYGALTPGGNAAVTSTAVDAAGNIYMAGYFGGTTFTLGSVNLRRIGFQDAFVAKLDSSGAVLWAKNYGGNGTIANANGIAVDASGNVYLGGHFRIGKLTTPALSNIGNQDAFVFKLDTSGTTTWAKNYGGSGTDTISQGIAVDGSGNVYLSGYFSGGNLTTPALTKLGFEDAFAFKLDSSGNTTWGKNYGGSGAYTIAGGIAIDASSNVYLSGAFDANLTAPALTMLGVRDAFAFKLDSSGTTTWAKSYGGSAASATASGIAVDASSNVYLGGYFGRTNLTTPVLSKIGDQDAFVFKLDATGNTTWAKNYGGSGTNTIPRGIAVDGSGNVYLAGYFFGANLTVPSLSQIGTEDAFSFKLDSFGTTTWAKNYGSIATHASANGLAVDDSGNVYLGGFFDAKNLSTPALTRIGDQDAFIIKQLVAYAVRSRKTHGTAGDFNLTIDPTQPITGAVTVEPRLIGSGHTIVFQFPGPINATGSASVSPVGSATATFVNNEVQVTLTNVPDNQRVKVTLVNVNGTMNPPPVSVGFLVGDVNNSRSVNSSDVSGVKVRSGQATTAANFKFDLNASGAINSSDISAVKARSGLVLP